MRPLGSAEQQWVVVQASYMADQGVLIEANKSSIANPPKQPVVELVRLSMQHLSFSLALHTRIVVDRTDGSSTPHGASLALHIGHFLRYAAAAGQAVNHSLSHSRSICRPLEKSADEFTALWTSCSSGEDRVDLNVYGPSKGGKMVPVHSLDGTVAPLLQGSMHLSSVRQLGTWCCQSGSPLSHLWLHHQHRQHTNPSRERGVVRRQEGRSRGRRSLDGGAGSCAADSRHQGRANRDFDTIAQALLDAGGRQASPTVVGHQRVASSSLVGRRIESTRREAIE